MKQATRITKAEANHIANALIAKLPPLDITEWANNLRRVTHELNNLYRTILAEPNTGIEVFSAGAAHTLMSEIGCLDALSGIGRKLAQELYPELADYFTTPQKPANALVVVGPSDLVARLRACGVVLPDPADGAVKP